MACCCVVVEVVGEVSSAETRRGRDEFDDGETSGGMSCDASTCFF
jgi:hypothetical protein